MKKVLVLLLLIGSVLSAGEIKIAVATNVSYVMEALQGEFTKLYPNTKVKVTLKSSGILLKEIRKGVPYGVFMSANMTYPEALYKEKLAITEPMVYAQGALAYFSTTSQNFYKGIYLLESDDINNIAVANPKSAPYGKAAIEAMKKSGVYENIKHKIVYADNIAQAFSYTVMSAEIGIVSKSSLFSKKMRRYKEGQDWSTVDPALYTPIKQGIVLLRSAENSREYKNFYDFMLSDKAKIIFHKFGYIF